MLAMLLHSSVVSNYNLSFCIFLLDRSQIFLVNSEDFKIFFKMNKFFHEWLRELVDALWCCQSCCSKASLRCQSLEEGISRELSNFRS
jgi:hypothetical protein